MNGVFGVTGVFFSTSATPNPLTKNPSSSRTIASAAPGTWRSRSSSAARPVESLGQRGRGRRNAVRLCGCGRGQSKREWREKSQTASWAQSHLHRHRTNLPVLNSLVLISLVARQGAFLTGDRRGMSDCLVQRRSKVLLFSAIPSEAGAPSARRGRAEVEIPDRVRRCVCRRHHDFKGDGCPSGLEGPAHAAYVIIQFRESSRTASDDAFSDFSRLKFF